MSNTCPTGMYSEDLNLIAYTEILIRQIGEAEHQSTLSKDLRTLRTELFPAAIRDDIEMRTESRIEIFRSGHHGDERSGNHFQRKNEGTMLHLLDFCVDCASNSSSFSMKERLSA